MNDNIDRDQCTVTYSSFDDAVALVVSLGPKPYMGKADIKSAFRLLPVNPKDFEVNRQYYYDRCMQMGCSTSCAVFEKFCTFLQACCRRIAASHNILHYLDYFFLLGHHLLIVSMQCIVSWRCANVLASL